VLGVSGGVLSNGRYAGCSNEVTVQPVKKTKKKTQNEREVLFRAIDPLKKPRKTKLHKAGKGGCRKPKLRGRKNNQTGPSKEQVSFKTRYCTSMGGKPR